MSLPNRKKKKKKSKKRKKEKSRRRESPPTPDLARPGPSSVRDEFASSSPTQVEID